MNPTLRALLLGAGFFTAAGLAVYSYKDSSTSFVDLQDAGVAVDCNPRIIVCHERLNPILRNRLTDAGYATGAKKYARIARQAFRCPSTDGGQPELIVPGFERFSAGNDDVLMPEPGRCTDVVCSTVAGFCGNGPKNVALMPGASGWVRAPLDGGIDCLRDFGDGGRWFGTGNVFPQAQAVGGNCEQVSGGSVIAGDDPDVEL